MSLPKAPLPIFDTIDYIDTSHPKFPEGFQFREDYEKAQAFLMAYRGSQGTFNAYRREIERLLHWSWLVQHKSIKDLKRQEMEDFILFCQRPPKTWIGVHKVPRFTDVGLTRTPSPEWRPFVVSVSKVAHRTGTRPDQTKFALSNTAIKETFAILSSFYNFLIQEEYVGMNPVALIRQKSKFIQKQQDMPKIRRLSELQWHYVLETAQELATIDPAQHERTLFIMGILYAMYLRISELVSTPRWTPTMNDFYRDADNNWWFVTVGKGNKKRQIAVSDAILDTLKRWRTHLNLPSLPTAADNAPLLPRFRGVGPISSTNQIRKIVQLCFDAAHERMLQQGMHEDAAALLEATVHWLRHTGISDDVKRRPREHVRDDAGHSSSVTTDRYIDIHLRERHLSAKNKPLSE